MTETSPAAARTTDGGATGAKPSVLFVCVHNAGRSQMAAGWLTALAGDAIEVRSAGTAPAGQVNPVAMQAMAEVGIDITAAVPKVLTEQAVQASDVVITMGCGDTCPFFPGTRYLDWQLDDPAGQGIEAVRPIRDAVKARVEELIAELLPGRPGESAENAAPAGSPLDAGRTRHAGVAEDGTVTTPPREVIIVGSGPAGYTAAIYAARADLRPLVFEGAVTAGGALMTTTDVENFPGFPTGVQGPQLMDNLRAQAERFGAELVRDDVTAMDLTGPVKRVWTGDQQYGGRTEHAARTVILATGSAYRRLGIPGEDELSGHGVSWCATCDGFFFRDQDVAVIGGGDSAIEEATFLSRFARSVTLVHRRDTLRASKIMQARAFADPKLTIAWNARPVEVLGTDGRVSGLLLQDTVTGQQRTLDVTGVFVAIGHDPRSELVKGQVDLDDAGYVTVAHPTTATNLPGVFACGDVVDHTYRQAITAAGSGCAAALDAEHYLVAVTHRPA